MAAPFAVLGPHTASNAAWCRFVPSTSILNCRGPVITGMTEADPFANFLDERG